MSPSDIDEGEEWRNGLCSHWCGGSCGVCWASCCCGCFVFGRTSQRLEKFPDTNTHHFNLFSGSCAILYAGLHVHLGWLPVLLQRQELRQKFGIKGNGYTDCLASYCCQPCTLAQMEMEMKDRAATAETVGNTQEVGYVTREHGMVYSPPAESATQGHPDDDAAPRPAPEMVKQGGQPTVVNAPASEKQVAVTTSPVPAALEEHRAMHTPHPGEPVTHW
ncbi:hypothetical protein LTR36_000321 [Oleoguttula mirabilis]|uniref:Uncharacterized protein n=1 Tax=Oleoguttula mirabilis TaxID=1507867 RepID=A0AAV9JZX6_9PEZI|nr:hypothetical protein LTR36_000321 [Oleoguttula mirabilis]